MSTIWENTLTPATGPKYKAVADRIRNAIQSGDLSAGDKLPPVRELAYQLEITPGTVARAYKELEQAALITTGRRNGTVVAAAPAGGDGAKDPASSSISTEVSHAADSYIAAGRAAGLDDGALLALIRARLGQRHKYGEQGSSQ